MKYDVEFAGHVLDGPQGDLPAPDALEAHLEGVMEQLIKLDVENPVVAAEAHDGSVEISVTITADSPEDAVAAGSASIRSAIHAAGGYTPDWEVQWCRIIASQVDEAADQRHLIGA